MFKFIKLNLFKKDLEKHKLEEEISEKKWIENLKLEVEEIEKQRLERQKLEEEKIEKQRLERQKLEEEKIEKQRLERQKLEEEKIEKQRLERQKLEEEKIEKQRLERQKLEEESLNNELHKIFRENSKFITSLGFTLLNYNNIAEIHMKMEAYDIGSHIFYENFMHIYYLVKDIDSIKEFESILNNHTLSCIIKKNFHEYGHRNNLREIKLVGKQFLDNKIDNFIINEFINGHELSIDSILDKIKYSLSYTENTIISYEPNIEDINEDYIKIAWLMIFYAKTLNKALLLLKYKERFVANNELFIISQNLHREIENHKLVGEKLYNIYTEFYLDTFKESLSEEEINVISKLVYIDSCDDKRLMEIDVNIVLNNINIDINKSNITYEDLYDIMCRDIKLYYDKNIEYLLKEDRIYCLYGLLIDFFIEKISIKEIINIYKNKQYLSENLIKYKNKLDLKRDKDRYIKNDFNIEQKINKDEDDYNNIKTGQQFEIYLKGLFSKLGYDVEITKASGDQGADLIILKEGIKTVVQAKFYSGTVGNKAVQEVVASIKFYNANKGMVVTNSSYTKSALELGYANSIELIDGIKLKQLKEDIYKTINYI